jgi:N-acetylneuraminic acid mutarotase
MQNSQNCLRIFDFKDIPGSPSFFPGEKDWNSEGKTRVYSNRNADFSKEFTKGFREVIQGLGKGTGRTTLTWRYRWKGGKLTSSAASTRY